MDQLFDINDDSCEVIGGLEEHDVEELDNNIDYLFDVYNKKNIDDISESIGELEDGNFEELDINDSNESRLIFVKKILISKYKHDERIPIYIFKYLCFNHNHLIDLYLNNYFSDLIVLEFTKYDYGFIVLYILFKQFNENNDNINKKRTLDIFYNSFINGLIYKNNGIMFFSQNLFYKIISLFDKNDKNILLAAYNYLDQYTFGDESDITDCAFIFLIFTGFEVCKELIINIIKNDKNLTDTLKMIKRNNNNINEDALILINNVINE